MVEQQNTSFFMRLTMMGVHLYGLEFWYFIWARDESIRFTSFFLGTPKAPFFLKEKRYYSNTKKI